MADEVLFHPFFYSIGEGGEGPQLGHLSHPNPFVLLVRGLGILPVAEVELLKSCRWRFNKLDAALATSGGDLTARIRCCWGQAHAQELQELNALITQVYFIVYNSCYFSAWSKQTE